MRVGVYAGSFDPITKGHENILNKAIKLVDKLYIAVGINDTKKPLFSLEERTDLIRSMYIESKNLKIESFDGSLAQFCRDFKCGYIIRGLRNVTDYEYEMQIAAMNKSLLNDNVETIFLVADAKYNFISSSMVKALYTVQEDISKYVSKQVITAFARKSKCNDSYF